MGKFETEVWKVVDNGCGYIKKNECVKSLAWDCGTTPISHYHDSSGENYKFNDTYLTMKSNSL